MNVKATGEGTNWWAQSVKKCVYSDYVHTDRLGSVVNLTDQYGRVPAQVDYDDWGKVTAYQSLDISGGYRTVLPEITYAGHQYDDVLGMYYAKARMYDAENRRFASVDPVKGRITEPMSMVQYLYVVDDPLRWVDLLGLMRLNLIEDNLRDGIGFSGTTTQKETVDPATKETQTPARKHIAPIQVKSIVAPTPSEQQKSGIDLTDIAHANVAAYSKSSGNATVKMGYLDANVGFQLSGGYTAQVEEKVIATGAFADENYRPKNYNVGISVIDAEMGAMKVEYDDAHFGGSVDVLHAQMQVGANNNIVGVQAMAELAGASGNVKIPLFNSGYNIVLTAEANVGSVGLVAGLVPNKGAGAKVSLLAGVGFFVDFQPCQSKSNGND